VITTWLRPAIREKVTTVTDVEDTDAVVDDVVEDAPVADAEPAQQDSKK
jgi:hypothetical protein